MPTPTSAALSDLVAPILGAQNIVAFCHVNPDGDAIGSLLGLGYVLDALPSASGDGPARARRVTLACQDPAPEILRFIPGIDRIVNALPAGFQPDLVMSLDASDPARLGKIFAGLAFSPTPLIVIDHHITNLHFGNINYVAPEVASTSQLIVALADALGVPLPPAAALPLLVGVVTDTLGFRTSNVTAAEMACAVRLMEAGANLADVAQRTLATRPLKFMRLWGMAFTNAHLDGYVLWAEVTRAMREAAGIADDDDGGLVSQLINTAEARVAVVFNELADGKIEVDFRSRPGYDVAAVALSLGGGGHPQAAGCNLPGPMAEAEARVLPLVQAASIAASIAKK
ncbi:MAG: DHH family phosphoesterase [Nitrososphaerales archaeon]